MHTGNRAEAWYGGLGPGVFAAVLAAVAADWFFVEPLHAFGPGTRYAVTVLAGFAVSCLFIVSAIARRRLGSRGDPLFGVVLVFRDFTQRRGARAAS